MKRIALILVISLITSVAVLAQTKEVRNATRNLDRGNLALALTHITNAINNPSTNSIPATWTLNARIHMAIAASTVPEVVALVDDPLTVAFNAIQKAEQLDTQNLNILEIQQTLLALSEGFFNAGAIAYNAQKFADASRFFEKSFLVSKEFNAVDTATLYNAGLAAELAGKYEKAIELYTQVADLQYDQPFLYISLTNLEIERGNHDKAAHWISIGRERYPDNLDLIFGEANVYLVAGNIPEARRVLAIAIERDPLNANLHHAFAVNFDNMARDTTYSSEERLFAFNEAVKAYNRAIEINPNYFDAIYNLGVIHFNEGIRLFVEAENQLRKDMNFREYQKREAAVKQKWVEAQPYLEKALTLVGDNEENLEIVLRSLRELYLRTNQPEKFEEINKKFNEKFGQQQE